jgi:hypothetical protein
MTTKRDLKSLIRARMEKTGESYTVARRHVLAAGTGTSSVPAVAAQETPSVSWNPLIETTVEEARELLARALELAPRLTHFGIGVHAEPRRRREAARSGRSTEAIDRELHDQRAELGKHLEEIAACADWIKRQRRIASFNLKHTSYGYKDAVERWFQGRGTYQYVSNGSFIAAALGLGFDGKPDHPDSPNLHFPFSQRTVKVR